MNKEKIEEFLEMLSSEAKRFSDTKKTFAIVCLKCGSMDIEKTHDGSAGPVCEGAYTASFDGACYLKCKSCGNAQEEEIYINLNGCFDE